MSSKQTHRYFLFQTFGKAFARNWKGNVRIGTKGFVWKVVGKIVLERKANKGKLIEPYFIEQLIEQYFIEQYVIEQYYIVCNTLVISYLSELNLSN